MPEYIYIRQVNQSSVHIGRTTDLEERYKLQADQTIEDFKEYLHIFECENGKGIEVEKDVKNKFKEYIANKNNKNEQYLWNDILQEKYTHYLRTHKYIIRQLEEDEVLKYNKDKNDIKVIVKKVKETQTRSVADGKTSYKDILNNAKTKSKSIQKDNTNSKFIDQDECYTRYEDVVKMVEEVKEQFKNKVVFCNCDDPLDEDERKCSAFALYFKKNFKRLKLKKLICIHFANTTDLFETKEFRLGLIYTYTGDVIEIKREKDFDGSFMHPESIKILNEEADIVCTNHPWSLTKEFYRIILNSKKRFLVVSPITGLRYSYIIPELKKGTIKAVKEIHDFFQGKRKFVVRACGVCMTNMKYKRKPYNVNKLVPLKDIPEKNIRIDDNGILLVDNGFIPTDYDKEFSISVSPIINGILENGYEITKATAYTPTYKNKVLFSRLLIKKSSK